MCAWAQNDPRVVHYKVVMSSSTKWYGASYHPTPNWVKSTCTGTPHQGESPRTTPIEFGCQKWPKQVKSSDRTKQDRNGSNSQSRYPNFTCIRLKDAPWLVQEGSMFKTTKKCKSVVAGTHVETGFWRYPQVPLVIGYPLVSPMSNLGISLPNYCRFSQFQSRGSISGQKQGFTGAKSKIPSR